MGDEEAISLVENRYRELRSIPIRERTQYQRSLLGVIIESLCVRDAIAEWGMERYSAVVGPEDGFLQVLVAFGERYIEE